MTEEKPYAVQLAVIVKLSNGKHYQVALTKEYAEVLMHTIPGLLGRQTLPLLPNELETISLESYKNEQP